MKATAKLTDDKRKIVLQVEISDNLNINKILTKEEAITLLQVLKLQINKIH